MIKLATHNLNDKKSFRLRLGLAFVQNRYLLVNVRLKMPIMANLDWFLKVYSCQIIAEDRAEDQGSLLRASVVHGADVFISGFQLSAITQRIHQKLEGR